MKAETKKKEEERGDRGKEEGSRWKKRGKRDAVAKPFSQVELAGLFSCNLHKTIFQPPVKTGFYEVSFRGQLVRRFRHSLLDCRCFKLQRLASL